MLDLNRLRVFRSVMASGTIHAAATNLGYTPSNVSQQISALQRETGLVLFEKEGRGITPTAAARELLARSEDLMAHLARLEGDIDDLREGRHSQLTVGYFASAGTNWMPELARRLTDELPDLTLQFVLTESPDHGEVPDINLAIERPHATAVAGYRRIPLIDDPYVVAVGKDHPIAKRRTIALKELADEPFIQFDAPHNPCQLISTSACEAAGFSPRWAVYAEDHMTALSFAAVNVGICLLPILATKVMPKDVRVVRLTAPTPVRRLTLQVRESAVPNAAADRAIEILREITEESRTAA